jgi:tRNA1Val (adenine37-N6)-methyltransferase
MSQTFFNFKQFSINQDKCAMKVGTDSILLGAWANFSNSKKVLDIGTGTGILALMAAQKSNAEITAIEIDKIAAIQAHENISNSIFRNRINVINTSIQAFLESDLKFDHIISNPPFFQNSLTTNIPSRTQARHNLLLNPVEIINATINLITSNGKLSVIWPIESGIKFICQAKLQNLNCLRLTYIKPNNQKKPHRLLLEFGFESTNTIEDTIIIENNIRHHYTDEYKKLTEDFYLYFKY